MKIPFLTIVVILLGTCSVTVCAQQTGLSAINLAYQNYHRLTMDVNYKVFESWTAANPLQEEKGALKRWDNMTWLKIGPMEFLRNPGYSVVVDHDDKTIAIMGIYGELPVVDYNSMLQDMENALQFCQEIKHKDLSNNQGQYDLVFPDASSTYKKVAIIYDKSTYLLQKIMLYYAQAQDIMDDHEKDAPPRLEITYSNINTDPTITPETFTYTTFLKKVGNSLVCTEKYVRYELTDKYSHP